MDLAALSTRSFRVMEPIIYIYTKNMVWSSLVENRLKQPTFTYNVIESSKDERDARMS